AKQSPATTLAGYGITDFVVKSLSNENLNNINTSGLYGQPANANATIALNYPETQAGTLYVSLSAYGVQQE
ncbi:pyocin knob domain-containing protein, partial [[Pasteurella] aerogenes]